MRRRVSEITRCSDLHALREELRIDSQFAAITEVTPADLADRKPEGLILLAEYFARFLIPLHDVVQVQLAFHVALACRVKFFKLVAQTLLERFPCNTLAK